MQRMFWASWDRAAASVFYRPNPQDKKPKSLHLTGLKRCVQRSPSMACLVFTRQNALSSAARWLRGNPQGHQWNINSTGFAGANWDVYDCLSIFIHVYPTVAAGTCLLEVRGCSQRGEVPWRQQDREEVFSSMELEADWQRWFHVKSLESHWIIVPKGVLG